ncbi:hypothetical protein HRG_014938 [Hirsutella rhossiliensis]
MAVEVVKRVTVVVKEAILKFGENVTRHAVYYDLVGQRGDDKTAMKAVKAYLEGYLDKLQKETIPEATKKFMARVEQKAIGA